MRPGLVIFDCDGVLVDTEPATNALLVERLARYGFEITLQEALDRFVGGTIARVKEKAEAAGARLPADWVAETYEAMFARLAEGVEPIPGVVALLDRLDAAGIPYCVASNGPPRKMEITLGSTGLMARFGAHLHSAHVVGSAKPEPGLFLHAAKGFGMAPADCVVIEDSASGAEAARRAGMRCLGYAAATPPERLEAQGAEIFFDMSEVPPMISLHT